MSDKNACLSLKLDSGDVIIKLRDDLAPLAAERMRHLADIGFYDGVAFHRVIEGFMAQGGDPSGTGAGGSDLPNLAAEFTHDARFERGTVGMARTMDPNTANSQFFIMFESAPSLDGQYTIVGEVISGMEHVDRIKRGRGSSGLVDDPDKIVSMRPSEMPN